MGCVVGSLASCCASSAASCCIGAGCSMCGRAVSCQKSSCTRGLYVFQFVFISVAAYVFSIWASDWLKNVPVLKECPDASCHGALAVYRITFGLTVLHVFLGLLTIGVRSSSDWRAQIQDGWWPVKFLALIGTIVGAFFIPNSFYIVYGWIMVAGAGIFIIVQLILLVEFAYQWNESWLAKMEAQEDEGGSSWYYALLGVTLFMIFGSIALTGVMYKFFSCSLNLFFITMNLIGGLILCVLALHPKVREGRPSSGLLQSAVIMIYTTYVIWSAIQSEPDTTCNPLSFTGGTKAISIILGALFTIVSVVYSTVRAASSSEDLLGTSAATSDIEKTPLVTGDAGDDKCDKHDDDHEDRDDEKDGVAYNYSHFHAAFALGSMYVCMLLTNWQTVTGEPGSSVATDSGMVSVWVKVVSSWITHLLYAWTLIGPVLLPDREWN